MSAPTFDFRGRIALVTGAGQGVGRQVALNLAGSKADGIVVNDYFTDRAEAVAAEVREAGARALPASCDVTDLDAVHGMVAKATAEFGRIDLLVNNAGNAGPSASILEERPFWETGPEDWQQWIGTNFFGVLNCARAVVGGMVERAFGRVVTVISDAARVGEPNLAVYSGAKAGAAGFTRALAKAVGRANVTANCVALGATITPTTEMLRSAAEDSQMSKRLLRNYVVKRFGEPADGAAAVLFLCSEQASWITGQTLPVNGGYSMTV